MTEARAAPGAFQVAFYATKFYALQVQLKPGAVPLPSVQPVSNRFRSKNQRAGGPINA